MDNLKIPNHLAIILDGNGRWAKSKGLIRSLGHKEGAKRLKEIVKYAFELNIYCLSVFAFSTENWKRPKEEIDYLFSLPKEFLADKISTFVENDWKIIFSGDLSKLPISTQNVCYEAMIKTKNCKKHIFNICLNYGGQDEILKACKEIALDYKNQKITLDDINKETFNNYLYTKNLPAVDLLIRTSNEKRISNFLIWQIAYAELYFTKTYWPMFTKKELIKALEDYTSRDRRFGGL